MSDILVSGLINIEVTLRVDAFPIAYTPVRYPFFGVDTTVSGVGYNVAKALTALGDAVHLVSMVGQDLAADQVRRALDRDGIPGDLISDQIRQTPHSVILYDGEGRRQINVDLKDVQGALLAVKRDRFVGRVPAVHTRQVVNTIGAGDALFSAFIHFYDRSQDPYEALCKAIVFASYKIGEAGAAEGFLDERELNDLIEGVRRES